MKLCSVCIKSDILCSECAKKEEKGSLTKTDIAMARALFKLGIDADFDKAVEADNDIFVITDKKSAGLMIGRSGRNARKISIMAGKNLRIIERTDDEKKLIERVLGVQVLGINKVYANSSESYKVRVERKAKNRPVDASVIGQILGKNVQLVFG